MIDYTFKICIFGYAGVGKTSLALRFVSDKFDIGIGRTLGADISMKRISCKGKEIGLQIWDFNGEDRFKIMLPIYSRGSAGGILMFDTTNQESLDKGKEWLEIFQSTVKNEISNVPILLVGSKLDLTKERIVLAKEALNFINNYKLEEYLECSSKTGENVEVIFMKLVDYILKYRGLA